MAEYAQQSEQRESQQGFEASLWRFAESVAGTLFSPGRTLREVGEREAIIPALFLVMLLVAVSVSGQVAVLVSGIGQAAGPEAELLGDAAGSLVAFQLMGIFWNLVWGPVLWTVTAGMLFGIAYLLGGRGKFIGVWAATGFALVPMLLAAPLAPITELAGALGPGWQFLGFLVAAPAYLLALVWTSALMGIAIRETMQLSGGRAFASVGILIGGFVLLGVMLVCAFIVLIIALAAAVA